MKILVLTGVYPRNNMEKGESCTKVVHEFAKSWKEQKHDVKVIHCNSRYPVVLHALPRDIRTKIKNKTCVEIGPISSIGNSQYTYDDVAVFRTSYLKIIPHGNEGKFAIKRLFADICAYLEKSNFTPDVIVAHWASPQAPLLVKLKEKYGARTSIVLHGTGYLTNKEYPMREYLKNIDKLGCRSKCEAIETQKLLGMKELPFICYSGIPDSYCDTEFSPEKFLNTRTFSIVCVSELIKRKNIDVLIQAVCHLKQKGIDVSLDIIGDGSEKENLNNRVQDEKAQGFITLHGRKTRDEVMQYVKQAHCFALLSKNEIFGLVYLEAMISSCITIGSCSEGIDGIIQNNINGFLSPAGDVDNLEAVLTNICYMKEMDKVSIARRGYETAKLFSNSNMAKDYLEKVMN